MVLRILAHIYLKTSQIHIFRILYFCLWICILYICYNMYKYVKYLHINTPTDIKLFSWKNEEKLWVQKLKRKLLLLTFVEYASTYFTLWIYCYFHNYICYGLKWQKCIFSQFQRIGAGNQGVSRARFPLHLYWTVLPCSL